MIASRINSQVQYKETRTMDIEDIGHKTAIYELDVFDRLVVVAIGKPKYTFANKNVVFFPIYLINQKNHINAQIGLFEVFQGDSINIFDEDGDIDIELLGEPLFYGFTKKIMETHRMKTEDYLHEWDKSDKKEVYDSSVNEDDAEYSGDEDDNKLAGKIASVTINDDDEGSDSIFKLGVPVTVLSAEKKNIKKTLTKGIFVTNEFANIPPMLVEETEELINVVRNEYRTSQTHSWIQKYMKNEKYRIIDVESNGDCFFSVVRDAFAQIGLTTTVAILRALVADEITDSIFQEHRSLFLEIDGSIRRNTTEMKKIKETVAPDLKRRVKVAEKNGNKNEIVVIVSEGKSAKHRYKELEGEVKILKSLIADSVGHMEDIDTIEKFRRFIQTSSYWANEVAISIIERKLNVKMIIMNEDAFTDNDLTSVLMCNTQDVSSKPINLSPDYYIIASLTRRHYSLVSYKNKNILTFQEIPLQIKTLVLNKCMEMNSGAFYMIQDFRNLKSKMGIDPDLGKSHEDNNDNHDYFDPDIVLMFYAKSNKHPLPGKGSGESILSRDVMNMSKLGSVTNSDWRRKLSDSWVGANFNLDGHLYTSVDHYYESAKFKSGFPEFSLQFSLDSDSEISKDINLAKAAGSITGIFKNKGKSVTLRPSNIKSDPEFYPNASKEARIKAVRAKFSQNQDLKNILLLTMKSKLTHYVSNQPPEVDDVLMKVRNELNSDNTTGVI